MPLIQQVSTINRWRGFSLIEVIVAVGILGLLAAVAVPAYQNYITKARVAEALALADAGRLEVEIPVATQSLADAIGSPRPLQPGNTNYVKTLTWTPDANWQTATGDQPRGAIWVVMDLPGVGKGRAFALEYRANGNWHCIPAPPPLAPGDLDPRYLPSVCSPGALALAPASTSTTSTGTCPAGTQPAGVVAGSTICQPTKPAAPAQPPAVAAAPVTPPPAASPPPAQAPGVGSTGIPASFAPVVNYASSMTQAQANAACEKELGVPPGGATFVPTGNGLKDEIVLSPRGEPGKTIEGQCVPERNAQNATSDFGHIPSNTDGLDLRDAWNLRDTQMCHFCAGPLAICEQLHTSQPCPLGYNFCATHVTNHLDGTRSVTRGCASYPFIRREWWQGTSDDDKCDKAAVPNQHVDFQCTFACVKPDCNAPLRPSDSTAYRGQHWKTFGMK